VLASTRGETAGMGAHGHSDAPDWRWLRVRYAPEQAGSVSFTAEELHCLTCAMAGNFPPQFDSIRMDLLRKLAKASRAVGQER
jgi:hypothetical protein